MGKQWRKDIKKNVRSKDPTWILNSLVTVYKMSPGRSSVEQTMMESMDMIEIFRSKGPTWAVDIFMKMIDNSVGRSTVEEVLWEAVNNPQDHGFQQRPQSAPAAPPLDENDADDDSNSDDRTHRKQEKKKKSRKEKKAKKRDRSKKFSARDNDSDDVVEEEVEKIPVRKKKLKKRESSKSSRGINEISPEPNTDVDMDVLEAEENLAVVQSQRNSVTTQEALGDLLRSQAAAQDGAKARIRAQYQAPAAENESHSEFEHSGIESADDRQTSDEESNQAPANEGINHEEHEFDIDSNNDDPGDNVDEVAHRRREEAVPIRQPWADNTPTIDSKLKRLGSIEEALKRQWKQGFNEKSKQELRAEAESLTRELQELRQQSWVSISLLNLREMLKRNRSRANGKAVPLSQEERRKLITRIKVMNEYLEKGVEEAVKLVAMFNDEQRQTKPKHPHTSCSKKRSRDDVSASAAKSSRKRVLEEVDEGEVGNTQIKSPVDHEDSENAHSVTLPQGEKRKRAFEQKPKPSLINISTNTGDQDMPDIENQQQLPGSRSRGKRRQYRTEQGEGTGLQDIHTARYSKKPSNKRRADNDLETATKSSKKKKPDIPDHARAPLAPGPNASTNAVASLTIRPHTHSTTPVPSKHVPQPTTLSTHTANRQQDRQSYPYIKQEWDDGDLQMFLEPTTPFREATLAAIKSKPLSGAMGSAQSAAAQLVHGQHANIPNMLASSSPMDISSGNSPGPPARLGHQTRIETGQPDQFHDVRRTLFTTAPSASNNGALSAASAQGSLSSGPPASRELVVCKICYCVYREHENGPGQCVPQHTGRLSSSRTFKYNFQSS